MSLVTDRPILAALTIAVAACSATSSDAPASSLDAMLPDAGAPVDDAAPPTDRDAGPVRSPYDGPPIDAPAGQWTWVGFPDTSCLNGAPAGLGINPGTDGTVLFYLEGGGACWNEATCFGPTPSAVRTTKGVSEADLAGLQNPSNHWPFNRGYAGNPFKNASIVYVPYCTGDFHVGAKEATYGPRTAKHFGRKNVEAFLRRLVPTFANASRIVLAGTSAGGYGAYLNFARVADAFAPIRVDLVDDAGPPLPSTKIGLYPAWSAAWDLPSNFSAACDGCGASFDAALAHYLVQYPNSHYALSVFTRDTTLSSLFQLSGRDFETALRALGRTPFDGHPNAKYYFTAGTYHETLVSLEYPNGTTTLGAWLAAMQSDDATWDSVKP